VILCLQRGVFLERSGDDDAPVANQRGIFCIRDAWMTVDGFWALVFPHPVASIYSSVGLLLFFVFAKVFAIEHSQADMN